MLRLVKRERQSSCFGEQVLVDHLLLVDEVGGLAEQLHEAVEVVRPVVEHLARVLLLGEGDHAGQPVHLRPHRLVHHQVGQDLFSLLLGKIEKSF